MQYESLLLCPAEVAELTGYKRPGDQIRWLDRERIPHRVGADGRPKVIRAHLMVESSEQSTRAPRLRL